MQDVKVIYARTLSPSLRDRYGVEQKEHIPLNSLKEIGLSDSDLDFVILSHLHFDHAGGLLSAWSSDAESKLLFPNAYYLVSKSGWERACRPHLRDRVSFIPHLNGLLERLGRLVIVEKDRSDLLGENYRFVLTNGHTPG